MSKTSTKTGPGAKVVDENIEMSEALEMANAGQVYSPISPVSTFSKEQAAPAADNFRLLEVACLRYLTPEDFKRVEAAYELAAEYHKDQRRRSGEPYINHPVEVCLILAEDLKMDADTIVAAMLHDIVEDTPATLEDVRKRFGDDVAELVDGVTKLTSIEVTSMDEKQALNLRKMFLAMSKDIRVIIIKLADRLHNMRTLAALPDQKRVFKAHETMDVYAPLADRLGIFSIKWELEDLAFFYIDPEQYQLMARMVQDSRDQRNAETNDAIIRLDEELTRVGLRDYAITGRPKHLWSIWQKMVRNHAEFTDIYDLIAIRVITKTLGDCYSALGAIHSLWHPLPGRFKDYIATPKANGYQSLHTTVIGPKARPLEIQIRTEEMHEQDEFGIAAHWLYKQRGDSKGEMSADDKSVDDQINWLRKSLDWAMEGEIDDPQEFLNSLRVELFEDEIFVFTPKGEVVNLRKGATPLDFAYAIHTEVGNRCVGAKVNGSVAPLNSTLEMGDRVEILTNKSSKPSRDWLNIVKTPSARSKIRKYFATATKFDDAETGRSDLARELRKLGYGISTQRVVRAIDKLRDQMKFRTMDDLLAAVGSGKISVRQTVNKIVDIIEADSPERLEAAKRAAEQEAEFIRKMLEDRPLQTQKKVDRKRRNNCGVVAAGDPDLLVHLAHCCNPVAGDEIVGFITRGGGVSVHRSSCPNVKGLMNHPERMIEVEWDTSGATQFQVEIVIEATDRMGLLKDVTIAVGDAGANILSAATQVSAQGIARLRFLIAISDASLLGPLLAQVGRVPSVFDARRIMPGEGSSQMKRRI